MTKQVIGPRIPRSWLEHLDDESWDVVDADEIESWVSQDLLQTRTSVSLNQNTAKLGSPQLSWEMSTPCTRSNVFTADNCSLRAPWMDDPLLIRGLPSPRTKTYTSTILSSSVFCNFQTCMSIRRPSNCSEPMFCMIFQMPANAGKSGSTLAGEFWGGHLDGVSGTIGFHLERWVSLMVITMLISAVGVNRTLLRRLLGGWAFALAFRRVASLDVSYTAATTLTLSRRCRLNGLCLMNFCLSQSLLLCWKRTYEQNPAKSSTPRTHLRVERGGCFASITREDWLALYELAEENGEHVRLDWKGAETPSSMHDARAAAAPRALKLNWTTLFSHQFFVGKHVNLLELESLVSLLRRITREGIRAIRLLVLVDSRVVSGAVSKGRSSSRIIHFLLRKLGFWSLAFVIALVLFGFPPGRIRRMPPHGASRSKVGVPFCQSFLLHQPQSLHQPTLSPSWICSVSCCPYSGRTCARASILRCLQLFGSKTCLCADGDQTGDPRWRKHFHAFECAATGSKGCQLACRKMRKKKEPLTAPSYHAGLAVIPSLLLQAGSVHRLASLCLWDHDQSTCVTSYCIEEVTSKNILDQNAHFFCENGTS